MFCKVYLQCGIVIQRAVTIHELPSSIIAYDKLKDNICKEKVSEYNLVY